MRKSVKEALMMLADHSFLFCQPEFRHESTKAYNLIKHELKMLDHYSKHIEMLESKLGDEQDD